MQEKWKNEIQHTGTQARENSQTGDKERKSTWENKPKTKEKGRQRRTKPSKKDPKKENAYVRVGCKVCKFSTCANLFSYNSRDSRWGWREAKKGGMSVMKFWRRIKRCREDKWKTRGKWKETGYRQIQETTLVSQLSASASCVLTPPVLIFVTLRTFASTIDCLLKSESQLRDMWHHGHSAQSLPSPSISGHFSCYHWYEKQDWLPGHVKFENDRMILRDWHKVLPWDVEHLEAKA